MRLLALDPGIRGCGVAVFANDVLASAAYVKNNVTKGDTLHAVRTMARCVLGWVGGFDTLVAERMQVYTQGARKGDPNDLVPLGAIVGAVAMHAYRDDGVQWVLPKEWKGTIPKGEAFEERVRERLTDFERSRIQLAGSLTHNVFDAIGIGLHHLGRFNRRRVFPR